MDNLETKSNQIEDKKANKNHHLTFAKSLSLALQFAFIILLPLLAFGFLGKWLEQRYENRFWLVGALVLALITSSVWFYKKISDLYKDFIE